MNVITHSLLPIAAKQWTELSGGESRGYRKDLYTWLVIGVFGSLPDILDPHFTLGDRCHSFSHVWPFTVVVVAVCCLYAALLKNSATGRIALWCAFSYVLHVFGDIVSGGLDFFCTGRSIGGWWIAPQLWPVFDIACIFVFSLFHRRVRSRYGLEPSIIREVRRRAHPE